MTKIKHCIEYDEDSGEYRDYHVLETKSSAWGNPNKVKIDVSPKTLHEVSKAAYELGIIKTLRELPNMETTRANKDYFHDETARDEMKVGVHYLLAYNKHGDFLSFNPITMKNIMPERCKAALAQMPEETKKQRCKKFWAQEAFISIAYMDRVVLHSNGEVSYLGRGYVDP